MDEFGEDNNYDEKDPYAKFAQGEDETQNITEEESSTLPVFDAGGFQAQQRVTIGREYQTTGNKKLDELNRLANKLIISEVELFTKRLLKITQELKVPLDANLIKTLEIIPKLKFKSPRGILLGWMSLVNRKIDKKKVIDLTKKYKEPFTIIRYGIFLENILSK